VLTATPKTAVVEVLAAVVANTAVAVAEPAIEGLAVAEQVEVVAVAEAPGSDPGIASSVHRLALDMGGSATQ
jgi:hypothetical protein